MRFTGKFASCLAIMVIAAAPAAPAVADGQDTSFAVIERVEAGKWPLLENGADGPDVCAVQYLLRGYDFPGKPDIKATCEFDDVTELGLKAFQRSRGLFESGKADAAVWETIKRDIAKRPIHAGHRNTEQVKAVQTELNKHRAELKVDGAYGRLTRAAVSRFQKSQNIGVDGVTGWITFQALVTAGPAT